MSEGERQKFEAWALEGGHEIEHHKHGVEYGYVSAQTTLMWYAWLARAEQPSQTRAAEGWISVLDRPPNVKDKLLVLDDAAYVHMAYHRPDSETYRFDCDTYGLKVSDVTHWMYVPEPPNAAAVPVEDRPAPTPQTWKQKVEPMEIEAGVTEDKEKP